MSGLRRRHRLAGMLLANQPKTRNLPANYGQLKAWLSEMRVRHRGIPDITTPEALDDILQFIRPGNPSESVDPTGTEYKYTPWLIREIGMGRLNTGLNAPSRPYVHKVLKWFEWLCRQNPEQIEHDFGFPAYDDSWKNIMAYTYSDTRGDGLAQLYRTFLESDSPLAVQFKNYQAHS